MFWSKKFKIIRQIRDLRDHFDHKYYLGQVDDIELAGRDPIEHYLVEGARLGLNPSAGFSTSYYLAINEDVEKSGINPFWHFIMFGKTEGRMGKPEPRQTVNGANFQSSDKSIDVVLRQFDPVFYRNHYPQIKGTDIELARHYLSEGWRLGFDPNEQFSTSNYLKENPNVASQGINPLLHYLTGAKSTGDVVPDEKLSATQQGNQEIRDIATVLQPQFNEKYYSENHPDYVESGYDPLMHYCAIGWKLGYDPSPIFGTSEYLRANPDVDAAGVNPFWHYITRGRDEGRLLRIESEATTASVADAHFDQHLTDELATLRPYFSSDFYLEKYPDVAVACVDPLLHFCTSGWVEGRDPNPDFSTEYYLEANPDIKDAGVNPFWHFIVAGQAEGRSARHPGGYKAKILEYMPSLEEEVASWTVSERNIRKIPARSLEKEIRSEVSAKTDRIVLSLGHDNYRENCGGVQLCIQEEEASARDFQTVYLNFFPLHPLPRLVHGEEDPDPYVVLMLNGRKIGMAAMSNLIKVVKNLRNDKFDFDLIVHHLLGHLIDSVIDLASAADTRECIFWTHDFFSLCPSFTLQRNGVSYCQAPPPNSNACQLCRFGEERGRHLAEIAKLFKALEVHVVFPSKSTKKIWMARGNLTPAKTTIAPHVGLSRLARKEKLKTVWRPQVRVGFLGLPAAHKGWHEFEKLVQMYSDSEKYSFVYFGNSELTLRGLTKCDVRVSSDNPDAMVNAVENQNIDIVFHWATWPETFSISTYEAMAAGAYILTNTMSGNVADTVRRLKRGMVLNDIDELVEAFESDRLIELASERRSAFERASYRYEFGSISFSVLERGV